jgi:glycosyltransferase involved in cell wall biosynthesis
LLRETARRGWDASLFSLVMDSVPERDAGRLASLCREVVFAPVSVGRASRSVRLARDMAKGRALHASYFASASAHKRLRRWLDDHHVDLILVDQLWMYGYLPAGHRARAILDCHNVEARRIGTMGRATAPGPRRIVSRLQLPAVQRYEASAVRSVARVLAVSEIEYNHLDALAPGRVRLVPNGIDTEAVPRLGDVPRTANLLFLGSLDYSANLDGARYLLTDIAPQLRRRDAHVLLVGQRPPQSLRALAARAAVSTEITGYVESTEPYWARSRMLVAPLRFAGGTRLKILEALARGVPVITTTLGAEGLDLEHERDVIIADDPGAFARAIDRVLSDHELCLRLARAGRRLAEERYDWRMIGDRLEDAMQELVAPARRSRIADRRWRADSGGA